MNRVIFLAIFVAASMSCQAEIIFIENFEGATVTTEANGGPLSAGVIPGTLFSVVSGNIDIKGPGWYPLLCSGAASGKCVDTVGGSGLNSGQKIETTLDYNLNANSHYRLTFDLGGWTSHDPDGDQVYNIGPHDATVLVTLGGDYSESFNIAFDVAPSTITRTFVSSGGSRKLAFENTESDKSYAGLMLDNITLEHAPEPSSIVLLGSGMLLALLVAARSRRRV
jgi:hypothetical protein